MGLNLAPRAWLFVPGDSDKKIAKAPSFGADMVIYDLEDSVAATEKDTARRKIAALLQSRPGPVCIRINPRTTAEFGPDLDALAAAPPALIMLPKCEGIADVASLAQAMADRGMSSRITPIATETARGVRALMTDRWDHPRLAGLTWGAEDLAADLGALENRAASGYGGAFALARDLCLLAAKEAGLWAIDTVFTDTKDGAGCIAEARAAFETGFDGKMAIHPNQVGQIQEAFTPAPAQVTQAQRILDALDTARTGVATLDGRMIDRPHIRAAEKILALAARSTP